MSRTKRIYNSYKRFGRFMPKQRIHDWFFNPRTHKIQAIPLPPFDLSQEKDYLFRRYHPYHVWCMGNCRSCKKGSYESTKKRGKTTRKYIHIHFYEIARYGNKNYF